jgi:hypothetical protein
MLPGSGAYFLHCAGLPARSSTWSRFDCEPSRRVPTWAFAYALAPLVSAHLDAGDVGGEEVDAVAVEVSTGAVVMLGGARVTVSSKDLRIA